ncbi:putative Zn-dependent peptidase [Scopulibacillus darangshiensis]|uniref:Putative Zn-dependent peptidase n=1 Tax=Scopulibacillus darangshiensis TaxID=442528 RepID=A0A4R2P5X4_9BACL|nr:pitrilysin family protein [Scopulibacillus darangshiensis]TCP30270.1 putative Zn-dependent peptidase [Scopulibacillus darangshiensis]
MSYINEQIHTLGGLNVHMIPTDKFKTLTLFLQFRSPLEKEDITKRALLSYVLKSSTAVSQSSQALQHRLDDLYGATLSTALSKKGDNHLLSLFVTVANERFISGAESLLDDAISLLTEVVFQPNAEAGHFDEKTVKKEKRALKQRLESIVDDKMRFANQRLIDEMCPNESYRLHTYGYQDELEKITAEELFRYYQKMLAEDQLDLYIVGDFETNQVLERVKASLLFKERQAPAAADRRFSPIVPERVNTVKEQQDVEQGKLNLGFRTNIIFGDALYHASQVFNGLFGGFPHSKLFMNVREKASLAYYAASRYESYKGLLIVMSGIEFENYDQAVDIIKEQLAAVQKGDFSEHEIDQTKALLKNAILESLDSPFSLIDLLYQDVLSGETHPVETWLRQIDGVTRDDIVRVAEQTSLDTIYFLQGEEGR